MTVWKVGDTGRTFGGYAYRVLCEDLKGRVGPLVVAVKQGEIEGPAQYPADGKDPAGLKYRDLLPPTGRVS